MTEDSKTRWIIQGKGHWIMAASAWIITYLAGFQLMAARRDETSLLVGLSLIPVSLFFWLLALRGKRTKD